MFADMMDKKVVAITPPGAIVDDASYTCASLDIKGWDWCTILVHLGATDIAMAALSLSEADADSGHAAISGATFDGGIGTDGAAEALPGAADDNKFFAFQIDCRKRKRFLKLVATAGNGSTGTYLTAIAILSRGKEAPNTMAERGITGEILV